jgi:hypothetical protein
MKGAMIGKVNFISIGPDLYEEFKSERPGGGWHETALRVLLRRFPQIPEKTLDAMLQKCGCHKPNIPVCGYQGSMSPTDFDRLGDLLKKELGNAGIRELALCSTTADNSVPLKAGIIAEQ